MVTLHDTAAVGELTGEQQWVVIIFERLGRPLGLLAAEPDMIEAALRIDSDAAAAGIASAVLHDRTILLLEIFELARSGRSGGASSAPETAASGHLAHGTGG